jgi:hypothetical protein
MLLALGSQRIYCDKSYPIPTIGDAQSLKYSLKIYKTRRLFKAQACDSSK